MHYVCDLRKQLSRRYFFLTHSLALLTYDTDNNVVQALSVFTVFLALEWQLQRVGAVLPPKHTIRLADLVHSFHGQLLIK